MLVNKRIKKGFTVAEVLVAAAIFMVFSGALFSIYRMGSRMFVSGSWKFNRQKEAERFFEILKERVEQASNVVKIEPSSNPQILTQPTKFKTKTGTLFTLGPGQTATSNKQLAEFAVCKPYQKIGNKEKMGLILYHSLTLVPGEYGLYDLCLRVEDSGDNTSFFNMHCIENLKAGLNRDKFRGNPSDFGLAPVPGSFKLRNVCSVTISYALGIEEAAANETFNAIRPSLYEIRVKMRNPKHEQTVLEMGYKFKIDGSVAVEALK